MCDYNEGKWYIDEPNLFDGKGCNGQVAHSKEVTIFVFQNAATSMIFSVGQKDIQQHGIEK